PPILLLHGLGGRSEDWMPLAPFLTRAGFRVYILDLPGCGKSSRLEDFSYSMTDQAHIVIDFMDHLNLRQVDLGGWSMGGWIAQRMAALRSERFRKLMLFSSAGLYVRPTWNVGLFVPENAQELAELNQLLMPDPPQLPDFVVKDVLREAAKRAWVVRRTLHTMFSGREVTDRILPKLLMPVLLVWGDLDSMIPLAQGEKMHELLPYSQLQIVEGCGHLAPNLCADQIGPGVVEFLQKQ
ncbi:MAG: alpha/beta hydrolase, partial [Acidobacteriota bacterium]|nr:alpha/beta hydrolase [Acidobacteriota bacterium]